MRWRRATYALLYYWRHALNLRDLVYRPAYNGYMKEAAFYYYLYFVFAAFHIAFSIYSCVAYPNLA